MEIAEALDIVVKKTGHSRFRELCNPTNPLYNPAYIDTVLRMAGVPIPHPKPRPLTPEEQAFSIPPEQFEKELDINLEKETVQIQSLVEARLEICTTCEYFGSETKTCQLCGCSLNHKLHDENQHCPIAKW